MGHRQHVVVKTLEPAASLPSPNAVLPQITVELRVYWPGYMGNESRVTELISNAAANAILQVEDQTRPAVPTHHWWGGMCLECGRPVGSCYNPHITVHKALALTNVDAKKHDPSEGIHHHYGNCCRECKADASWCDWPYIRED